MTPREPVEVSTIDLAAIRKRQERDGSAPEIAHPDDPMAPVIHRVRDLFFDRSALLAHVSLQEAEIARLKALVEGRDL